MYSIRTATEKVMSRVLASWTSSANALGKRDRRRARFGTRTQQREHVVHFAVGPEGPRRGRSQAPQYRVQVDGAVCHDHAHAHSVLESDS